MASSRAVFLGWWVLGALFAAAFEATADPNCSCNYEYVPARYSNTQAGDIVGHHNPESLVYLMVSQMGETTNHILTMYDSGGARVTQQHFDWKQINKHSCSTPLSWDDLKSASPGIRNNVVADSSEGLYSIVQ